MTSAARKFIDRAPLHLATCVAHRSFEEDLA